MKAFWNYICSRDTSEIAHMSPATTIQTITSSSDHRKNVPVVTIESFYNAHAEGLQLKLEGKRVGFNRKIREPTINRPGLALSGFYT